MEAKTCTKCGSVKPADREHFPFYSDGLLRPVCRVCERARIWAHMQSQRSTSGRSDRSQEYAKRRADRAGNKGTAIRRLVAALRRAARSKVEAKKGPAVCWLWNRPGISPAEKYATRYRLDEEFRIHERLRRQMTKQAKKDGIAELMRGALKRGGTSNAVQRLVGYSIADLRAHLERQFVGGMSWANMADWHIDHIVPQRAFDLSDPEQWRRCWCMSNLRPMWGAENVAKGAKRVYLL